MTNNNEEKRYEANTYGLQWYGRDDKYEKACSTRYFGDKLVVGIHGVLSEKLRTSKAKYDYKGGTLAYLTCKIAKQFAKEMKKVRNALASGEDVIKTRAVPSGSSKTLLEVGPGSSYNCNPSSVCIAIYTLSPDSKAATAVDIFEFESRVTLLNYKMDGTYDVEPNSLDLDAFIETLEEFSKAMTNAMPHAIKKDFKFSMDRIMQNQLQTMQALGIRNESARVKTDWSSDNNSISSGASQSTTSTALQAELSALYDN